MASARRLYAAAADGGTSEAPGSLLNAVKMSLTAAVTSGPPPKCAAVSATSVSSEAPAATSKLPDDSSPQGRLGQWRPIHIGLNRGPIFATSSFRSAIALIHRLY